MHKKSGQMSDNVYFIKNRTKLSSVLLLILVRSFMKQTLLDHFEENLKTFQRRFKEILMTKQQQILDLEAGPTC